MTRREIKIARFILVFMLITSWVFSGWPQIWPFGELGINTIRIPPKIKDAYAAVPTYQAAGGITAGTGAKTIAMPGAGLVITDDILLLACETANEAVTVSGGSETWTEIPDSPQGTGTAGSTGATRLTVFWARASQNDPTSPTTNDPGNHVICRITSYRGIVTTGDPWDVTAGAVEATADTSVAIPGTTTNVADTLVVAIVAADLNDANNTSQFSSFANSDLTSVTERTDNAKNSGNGGSLGIATGVKAAAGAYGDTTATHVSSVVKGMISIALKPPVGNAAPTVSNVSLNSNSNITLTENTTTSVLVTGTLTDTNGGADISAASSTVYRSGVGSACAADDNNCYRLATTTCELGAAVGNDKPATCTAAVWFHAQLTDGTGFSFSSEIWSAELTAIDVADAKGSATNSTETIELNTLIALDVTGIINYGTLTFGATTSIANQSTVQVTTTGNRAINVELQATSSDSGGSGGMTNADFSQNIPVDQQQVTTNSNKEYQDGAETDAEVFDLSSTTALSFELESATPTTHTGNTSDEADDTFWKIGIPTSQTAGTYNGTTTATAVED